jgi:hypothetical protein
MPKSSPLYLLSAIHDEPTIPIAVYDDHQAAQAEAERLEAEYKKTFDAYDEWCNRRIGPRPEVIGYECMEVEEVEYRPKGSG